MSETIMNAATVKYTYSGASGQITETSNTANITLKNENSLTISKTSQTTSFAPGSSITYIITIENTGTSYFSGVRITDNLSGSGYLYYVSKSALLYYNQQYLAPEIASTSPLVFTLPPLSAGQKMILNYTCKIPTSIPSSVSKITNSVEGIGYTYNSTAKSYSSYTITRSTTANISITKETSTPSVALNELFNYKITLKNNGSLDASVNSVTDNLPTNFKLSSVKLKIGSNAETTLSNSDYELNSPNEFKVPSSSGPTITVPAASSTIITLNGYFASWYKIFTIFSMNSDRSKQKKSNY